MGLPLLTGGVEDHAHGVAWPSAGGLHHVCAGSDKSVISDHEASANRRFSDTEEADDVRR